MTTPCDLRPSTTDQSGVFSDVAAAELGCKGFAPSRHTTGLLTVEAIGRASPPLFVHTLSLAPAVVMKHRPVKQAATKDNLRTMTAPRAILSTKPSRRRKKSYVAEKNKAFPKAPISPHRQAKERHATVPHKIHVRSGAFSS